jgi:uncharacterized protein YoxC
MPNTLWAHSAIDWAVQSVGTNDPKGEIIEPLTQKSDAWYADVISTWEPIQLTWDMWSLTSAFMEIWQRGHAVETRLSQMFAERITGNEQAAEVLAELRQVMGMIVDQIKVIKEQHTSKFLAKAWNTSLDEATAARIEALRSAMSRLKWEDTVVSQSTWVLMWWVKAGMSLISSAPAEIYAAVKKHDGGDKLVALKNMEDDLTGLIEEILRHPKDFSVPALTQIAITLSMVQAFEIHLARLKDKFSGNTDTGQMMWDLIEGYITDCKEYKNILNVAALAIKENAKLSTQIGITLSREHTGATLVAELTAAIGSGNAVLSAWQDAINGLWQITGAWTKAITQGTVDLHTRILADMTQKLWRIETMNTAVAQLRTSITSFWPKAAQLENRIAQRTAALWVTIKQTQAIADRTGKETLQITKS